MPNSNAGLHNALKMREMFLISKLIRCRLIVEDEPFEITLTVFPHNGEYLEREVSTYKFNADGTYTKHSHQ